MVEAGLLLQQFKAPNQRLNQRRHVSHTRDHMLVRSSEEGVILHVWLITATYRPGM